MSFLIEEEAGTYTGRTHPHNGYWAGDFFPPTTSSGPTLTATDPPSTERR
jgi:hypothetical protein